MSPLKIGAACAALGSACALGADPPFVLEPAERGAALYELRCLGCHAESVHGREKRVAADFDAVRAWVERWNAHLRLEWSAEEVTDVAVHLNRRYYRYSCPPTACKVLSLGPRRAEARD